MFAFISKLFSRPWRVKKPLIKNKAIKFDERVRGISFEDWVHATVTALPENSVVLVNPDFTKKPSGFWNQMPRKTALAFQSDLVVLTTTTYKEAHELWKSIDPEFATAYLVEGSYALVNKRDIHSNQSSKL